MEGISVQSGVRIYTTCRTRRQCYHIGLQALHPRKVQTFVTVPDTRKTTVFILLLQHAAFLL